MKFSFKAKVMHTFATFLPDLTNFRLNLISFAYCLLIAGLLNSFNGFGFYIFVFASTEAKFRETPYSGHFFPSHNVSRVKKLIFSYIKRVMIINR